MLNMSEFPDTFEVKNEKRIAVTENRKKIIDVLNQVFPELEPSKVSGNSVESILKENKDASNLYVIGFGKASLKMYEGARIFTSTKATYSALIIPEGEETASDYPELELLRGNHPIPGKETRESSEKLMSNMKEFGREDVVIVLISGGGSALFEVPAEGLTVEQIGETSKCLMSAGSDIRELNMVRHAMSAVKGGKLAEVLYPARIYSLIISDVPGDDLQMIASGPLTRPSYKPEELNGIIRKYSANCEMLSKMVKSREIPKKRFFSRVNNRIILRNSNFVDAIETGLMANNGRVIKIREPITGDVEEVAQFLAGKARNTYNTIGEPFWLVGGGETTATVHGKGIGGRNCELSVRFSKQMKKDEEFTFASIGTDGIDGVSPAMGGLTDNFFTDSTDDDEISESLDSSDSYSLLDRHNSAIITGYTGTNVSDIFILYYGGTALGLR